ncbi:MAG: phosphoadenosine phosphosulfate reductase [Pseudomonadota bacterium]
MSKIEAKIERAAWRDELKALGDAEGFYEDLGAEHTALFVRRGGTLIVTFENLDHVFEGDENRMPWGYNFVEGQNWSMLGLMAHGWTWYRDEAVFDFFDRLRDDRFFTGFEKVVFYGASMGAYAAANFSAASPGATVIMISPQATLDRQIASWETRYHKAWARNYNSRYGYGPQNVQAAEKAHLFYDPRMPLDAMHAALFQSENIVKYPCRYMGHRIASLWILMKLLKPVVRACVDGDMSPLKFAQMMRVRRHTQRYQREMLTRLEEMGRPRLVAQYCRAVLATRGGPKFRKALRAAETKLRR